MVECGLRPQSLCPLRGVHVEGGARTPELGASEALQHLAVRRMVDGVQTTYEPP